MSPVLDHTQDITGTETHRLTNVYEAPEFVKKASHDQLHGDPAALPSHAYADPTRHLYPMHSASAVWMSTLFLMDKKAEHSPDRFEHLMKQLDQHAAFFGITGHTETLKQKMAADEGSDQARLPDAAFALVWDVGGVKDRHYPLRNAGEVKVAADWLRRYRDEFDFDTRQRMAAKILDRADEFGASVGSRDDLNKMAGYGACAARDIQDMLQKRASLVAVSFPDYAAALRSVATSAAASPPSVRDHGIRMKLASHIDTFDRLTKLTRLYADGLERPEDILFQVGEKQAAEFIHSHISMTSGSIYEKQSLAALTLPHIQSWMGDTFAEAVQAGGVMVDSEKLAEVATTLPRPDAMMFDRMAAAAGVPVFARDKTSADFSMSTDEMTALASMYNQQAPLQLTPSGSVLD